MLRIRGATNGRIETGYKGDRSTSAEEKEKRVVGKGKPILLKVMPRNRNEGDLEHKDPRAEAIEQV